MQLSSFLCKVAAKHQVLSAQPSLSLAQNCFEAQTSPAVLIGCNLLLHFYLFGNDLVSLAILNALTRV